MDINSLISSLENAENDNKRFALLLILAQLIKTNKLDELKQSTLDASSDLTPGQLDTAKLECRKLNERLFASIDPHFLARLLTTRQTSENISPVLYKAVSLSILTQFLDYESLACDPVLLSKLDVVCQILVMNDDEEADVATKRNLCSDTFKYLFALSRFIPDHLCQNTNLLDILVHKIILNESYPFSGKTFSS